MAVALGLVLARFRQPPIVGYIVAGVVLGPTGLGWVDASSSITLLAELGVLLLLFLIGMEISVRAFVLVLKPAVLVAGGQLLAGLAISALFAAVLGWSLAQTVLIGFIVALSSTAVAMKMLEEIDELRSEIGRITIGVMIAQDIAIVPMLIVAEALGHGGRVDVGTLGAIAVAAAFLAYLFWRLNRPGKIHLPFADSFASRRDMLALAALTFCFGAATIASFIGLSPVFGAFVAGLIVGGSTLRAQAIELTYPIQSILIFIFFLSIGLLIDLDFVADNAITIVGFVILTVVAKTVLNVVLVRRAGYDWASAVPAGLAMAQIGEFSFVLAAVGMKEGILDADSYRLALATIAVTLVISPLWIIATRRVHAEASARLWGLREVMAAGAGMDLPDDAAFGIKARWRRARAYGRAVRMSLSRRGRE